MKAMNDHNFKTCRYCSEKIAGGARVCPRCGQWLSIFSLKNPAVLIAALCVWTALTSIAFDLALRKRFSPGIDFLPYRNQISITESHMAFRTNSYEHEPVVSVIAIVTNQTDLAWKEIPLEVRFFDKAGTMIDVGKSYDLGTLYPKSDAAVNVEADVLHPVADYASYKIYVGCARDARSPF
jgi:hypothetical protein